MEKLDKQWWKEFKTRYDGTRLDNADFDVLCRLHSNYFKHSFYKPCSCNGGKIIKEWAQQLDELYRINQ